MPAEVAFATKPKLGRAMLERAFRAGVPCAWVTGDSVYGADHSLRRAVEKSGRGYVLAVTSGQHLGLKPVADWLEDVPGRRLEAAERRRRGQGAAPVRLGLAALPVRRRPGLAEGSPDPAPDRQARRVHLLSDALARRGDARRAGAGGRHALDHRGLLRGRQRRDRARPVRGADHGPAGTATSPSPCWRTPTSPSYAGRPSGGEVSLDLAADLLPLTVPEVRRLLWRLMWARAPDPEQVLRLVNLAPPSPAASATLSLATADRNA